MTVLLSSVGVLHVLPDPGERQQRPDHHLDRDTIQGTFRHQVAYPPGTSSSQQVRAPRFTTKRPTWANDNLFQKLQANGVTVSANPEGTPLWEDLLLRFGPALLFGALLY